MRGFDLTSFGSPRSFGQMLRGTNDTNTLGARFGDPGFPLASQQLAHVGAGTIAGKAGEGFAIRIEADYRIGAPVGQPHLVIGIDPDGIGAWTGARQLPLLPALGGR